MLILAVLAVVLLQIPQSKSFINYEVTQTFNEQFEGRLHIERVGGFLPFSARAEGVKVFAPSDSTNPVLAFDDASITINWWELLQQNLAISSLKINGPDVQIGYNENQEIALVSAFRQREERQRSLERQPDEIRLLQRLSIFAPSMGVDQGSVTFDSTVSLPDNLQLPSPLLIENVNFNIFMELSDHQIFFELPNFVAEIPDSPYELIQLGGQFYNDERYFELNRFRVGTAIGHADFSFEAVPVNLFGENIEEQFRNAAYRFQITEGSFKSDLIRQFVPGYPAFEDDLELELLTEGTFDEYYIDKFLANIGESSLLITGHVNDLLTPDLSYLARLDNVVVHPTTLDWISETYLDDEISLNRYQLSTIRGKLSGDRSHLTADFESQTEAGSFLLDGNLQFADLMEYDLRFEVDTLDITPFLGDTLNPTIVQGRVELDGQGLGEDARIFSSVDLSQSRIYGYDVDSFIAEFSYATNQLNYDIRGGDDELHVSASGRYGRSGSQNHFVTDGEVQSFDIKKFMPGFYADRTQFNSTFSANVRWEEPEDLFGRVSLEMDQSTIDQDTLRAHQFYADINEADNDVRTLRFTSSFFDGELHGTLRPELIRHYTAWWGDYLDQRIAEEIRFAPQDTLIQTGPSPLGTDAPVADISIEMTVKDLSLLRKYFPDLPDIESNARLNTSINATKNRLLITGNLFDQQFQYGEYGARDFNAAYTANFRHDNSLKEFSTVDLQVNSSEATVGGYQLKDSYFNVTMRNDSLLVNNNFQRLDDDLRFESTFTGFLHDDRFDIRIDDFSLGTQEYLWVTEGVPQLSYTSREALHIDQLILISDSDYLEINGTYSAAPEDRMEYIVENFDLSRVSDLIGGRIRFSGIMNGNFFTQTLTQIPSIQGELSVEEGRILDRLIGDVSLNSQFNSESNQFDTDIHIFTDPEKYPRYYNRNDGIGQDLRLSGFFKLPDDTTGPDDDLFYFDADLRQIDMWIATFIVPNIVLEMEGSSTGSGYIRGSENDFDFSADFQIEDVYGRPAFTNTGYMLNGELEFNLDDGLLFKDIQLTDENNGTGTLFGQVDLDRFETPATYLDLTLDLDNLLFMNNPYDPDIPFYGRILGTGQAQITGTSNSPVLRTTRPLTLSPESRISIPLEPEIQIEQDRRFIQFVESFDLPFWEGTLTQVERNGVNGDEEEELTFLQLFTMDLQFQAPDPVNVRLIFDRVTNDMLSANGTGQIRILLEDQDVSMFGRFGIQSGNYQFVSGDIFTRRFTLQEGGSISWSGDLLDASLDVSAVYRARPNLSSLLTSPGAAATTEPGQRIPIDLVLQIGGTITAVENEFFFRVPSGIEASVDPTIASQINNINQNDDEKLIQATSILLSGNFIPSSQAQGLGFAEGFSGTASVVNPLITSQVINPLLSNQINSLLRSDITFDIDFNLTAFNEVDLGVALRLFDDRVILRREGQITGEQSDIGDIGATYRINRTFSVTAFHRQDPTLNFTSGLESRQAQEMNGVGLEAQVQFNTWRSLRTRISNAFRSFLGIKQEEQEIEETEDILANN